MSCEIFTGQKEKKRNLSFIFHAHVGGEDGGDGFDFAYSVSLLLNSKRVTKASLPCREVQCGGALSDDSAMECKTQTAAAKM